MTTYDPEKAPDSAEWLAIGEGERLELVRDYHRRERLRAPKPELHAAIHAVVENQLAMGVEVVAETYQRLRDEGLNRHDTVHAIGAVLTEHMFHLMRDKPAGPDLHEAYYQKLKSLTASSWKKEYG